VTNLTSYHTQEFFQSVKNSFDVDVSKYVSNKQIISIMNEKVADNVALIKDIPIELEDQIKEVVSDAVTEFGVDRQSLQGNLDKILTDKFRGRFRAAKTRAKLIARDQTSKITSTLTEARHKQIGVSKYTWLGVGDSRERSNHVEKNNKIFAYSSPPGDTGNPGQDYQCRCVAVAVIDTSVIAFVTGIQKMQENSKGNEK
jgi:SPP1 gp7 family putative phage head morphogenesis protein